MIFCGVVAVAWLRTAGVYFFVGVGGVAWRTYRRVSRTKGTHAD